MYLRQAMGPFAQGPVALIARHGDECVFSADALGLRPLWQVETPDDFIFSSEPGVVSAARRWSPSRSRSAPGEKVHGHDRPRRRARSRLYEHEEMQRAVAQRWLERTGRRSRRRLRSRARDRRPARGRRRSRATPPPARRSRSRSRTGCSPASAGSATTSSSASRWPRTAPSRSARSATTGRWPRSRRSARTSPTTSRRPSPWSPTRRSTASARSSTSRPARCSAAGRRIDAPGADTRTIETSFPVILGGHHDLAPLSDSTYRRIAREHKTYLLEDLWEEFRGRAGGDRHLAARVGDDPGRDRAHQAGGRRSRSATAPSCSCSPTAPSTTASAATSTRTWRPPAIDQAPEAVPGRRPGEENLRRRCVDRAALGGDPQRPRRGAWRSASAPTASART